MEPTEHNLRIAAILSMTKTVCEVMGDEETANFIMMIHTICNDAYSSKKKKKPEKPTLTIVKD